MTTEIVVIDKFKQQLDVAITPAETRKVIVEIDLLLTLAKSVDDDLERINELQIARIEAIRQAGRLLASLERGQPGQPKKNGGGPRRHSSPYQVAYTEAQLSERMARFYQQIAAIPESIWHGYKDECLAIGSEISLLGFLIYARKRREKSARNRELTNGRQPTLYVASAECLPLDDETVDLIVTSPPYNLGKQKWPMGGEGRRERARGIGYQDDRHEMEYQDWQVACLVEFYRVAKPGASFFYNHKTRNREGELLHPMDWLRDERNPWTLRQELIWDRKSTHNHSPTLFWPEDERIYWLTKGRPALPDHPIGLSTVWREFGPIPDKSSHPAPFTDELPEMLIKAVGREGITVLDPFAGSCTTLRVALRYGYDAIGVDINPDYLRQAAKENGWTLPSVL